MHTGQLSTFHKLLCITVRKIRCHGGVKTTKHLTRKMALDRGMTDRDLTNQCRSGTLTRLRRGLYVPTQELSSLNATARHELTARDVIGESGEGAALSHVSAAILHGLPVWELPLNRVRITVDRRSGSKTSRHRVLHTAALPAEHVTTVDGVVVTTVARTVVDIARTAGFEHAVVVGDAAMRNGIPKEALLHVLTVMRRWRGLPAARRAVNFLDGRSESVGESRSRVALLEFPLPPIELQYPIYDDAGKFIARADFALPDLRVLGEFDGRMKYGRALNPGQNPEEVLWQEKRREDRVRELDWQFARWVWSELSTPQVIYERILRAAARAGHPL